MWALAREGPGVAVRGIERGKTRILRGVLKESTQVSQEACGFGKRGPEMTLKQSKAHSWRGDEEVQKLRPGPNRSRD